MADVKPADVYVGVVELFSVLLPGAFLTGALVVAAPVDPGAFSPLFDEAEAQWVAFALVSYALGAIVFSFASDMDAIYDKFRRRRWPDSAGDPYDKATDLRFEYFRTPRAKRVRKERKRWWLTRALRKAIYVLTWAWFIGEELTPVAQAKGKSSAADDDALVDVDEPMNTFAWAKTLLSLRAPGALAEVQRFEAESKFFRSVVLVLPVVGVLGVAHWWRCDPALAAASAILPWVLAPLCFRRYAEQRHKSTNWAYQYVISLQLGPPPESLPKTPPGAAGEG